MAANIAELRKAGHLTAKAVGGATVQEFFKSNQSAMAAVLPKHVNPERMLKIALTAIRTTPKLMECELNSLMGAIMIAAQLGLEPNTPLGHAYLIPFNNRRQNRVDVQFIPGYKGLIDLARRSGQIVSIAAHVVYSRDDFDYEYGLNEMLRHKPAMGNRGEMIAAYAVAKLKDGGHSFEVMSREQIDAIRDNSQGYSAAKRGKYDHPWISHYDEMARKTAIRRLFKYLPVSIEMATAVALDAKAADEQDQNLADALTGDYTILDTDAPQLGHTEPDEPTADPQPEAKPSAPDVPPEHADTWTVILDAYNDAGPEGAQTAYETLKPAEAKALNAAYRALVSKPG